MKYDKLIIVESPSKAKTIAKFIDGAIVLASKGHIRDLSKYPHMGIYIKDGIFTPNYEISKDHKEIVKNIKYEAKDKRVYIASDEDREGEAIGYHIATILGGKIEDYDRIVFHEITKSAILKALDNPRKLDLNAVKAQETRRMLDRIVGFKLSPLLSAKIESRLSAGRVQSAALKIVTDRERAIRAFVPLTYYELPTVFEKDFPATLYKYKGVKLKKQSLTNKEEVEKMKETLLKDTYKVDSVGFIPKKTSPQAPFKTTTLQQTASTVLGYDPATTMSIAQKLYEGVDTPHGRKGAITYMRTDSLNLAQEAVKAIRQQIVSEYGEKYLSEKPRVYTTTTKGAQEAHEAIRVTDVTFTPKIAEEFLDPQQLKLYTLIYNRTLMCQMADSHTELKVVTVISTTEPLETQTSFHIEGRTIVFDGWTKLRVKPTEEILLPEFKLNQPMKIQSLDILEKQTEPPHRYNAASLVKTLEEEGIGRPSTYASIINTLIKRRYVEIQNKAMHLTPIGEKITIFLEQYFPDIVDSHFTSTMEDSLDKIAMNQADMQEILRSYCLPLMDKVKETYEKIPSTKPSPVPTGESCPQCGSELVKRPSRFGDFIGCSGYPKCKYIVPKEQTPKEIIPVGDPCPKCNSPVVEKKGKYGKFYGCSNYPNCKFMSKYPVGQEPVKENKKK